MPPQLSEDAHERYQLLSQVEREAVHAFITGTMVAHHRADESHDSRALHRAYLACGGTISHGAFKGAMLYAKHKPTDASARRDAWTFCLVPRTLPTIPRARGGTKHWRRARAEEVFTPALLPEEGRAFFSEVMRRARDKHDPMPIYRQGDRYVAGQPGPDAL